tara:strand:- start:5056 stop:7242 length:2187 start_codon:yes stop_codon:yes gene_type:complete
MSRKTSSLSRLLSQSIPLIFCLLLFVLSACSGLLGPPAPPADGLIVVSFPLPGKVKAGEKITLSASSQATIYYTTDGTTPDRNAEVYTQPIALWSSVVLRAVAFDEHGHQGSPSRWEYDVDVLAPVSTVEPSPGNYEGSIEVTLSSDEPAQIYYTIDGSEPTPQSSLYEKPLKFTSDTSLRYMAVDRFGNREAPQRAFFNFPPQVSVWPPPGVYESKELILYLRTGESGNIFYKIANISPDIWIQYGTPLRISQDTILQVQAVDQGQAKSEPIELRYGLVTPLKRGDIRVGYDPPQVMFVNDLELFGEPSCFLIGEQQISVLPFTSTGPKEPIKLANSPSSVDWVRSWDFDGDGLADILLRDQQGQLHYFATQTRTSIKKETGVFAVGSDAKVQAVVPLDADGDGVLDLFVLDARQGESRLWKQSAGRFSPQKDALREVEAGAFDALSGDWNDDRKADLLILPGGTKLPYLLYGDGKGGFQAYTLKGVLENVGVDVEWRWAARTDVDADGDLDLVLVGRGRKEETSTVKVLFVVMLHQLTGQGWKRVFTTEVLDRELRGVMLSDPDLDGYPDLGLVGKTGGTLWMKNILGESLLDATSAVGLSWPDAGPMAMGDLSRVGFPSFAVWGRNGFLRLFSEPPRGKFIRLVIRGNRGNRSAIGTKILLKSGARTFLREVGISSTSPDQSELLLPIGLGDVEAAGDLTIVWSDGQKREIPTPELGKTLVLSPQ